MGRTVLNGQSNEIQNNICENRIALLIFCKNFKHRTRHQFSSKYSQLLLSLIKLLFSAKSKFSATFSQAFWTKSFSLKALLFYHTKLESLSLFLEVVLLIVNIRSLFLSVKQSFISPYSHFYFLSFLWFPFVKHFFT